MVVLPQTILVPLNKVFLVVMLVDQAHLSVMVEEVVEPELLVTQENQLHPHQPEVKVV